jgi:hypothetical protein
MTARESTNTPEPVLLGGLFISAGRRLVHLSKRNLLSAGLDRETCDHPVEMFRRAAAGPRSDRRTPHSCASVGRIHQHHYRPDWCSGPLQLPRREDPKPGLNNYSCRPWFGELWTLVALAVYAGEHIVLPKGTQIAALVEQRGGAYDVRSTFPWCTRQQLKIQRRHYDYYENRNSAGEGRPKSPNPDAISRLCIHRFLTRARERCA